MKIFLITDIHFGNNIVYTKVFHDPSQGVRTSTYGELFEQQVPKLKEVINSCDIGFNLGDLISDTNEVEDIENYKKAVNLLESNIPVKHVLGNHDVRIAGVNKISEFIGGKPYYSLDFGGYHHIVLDANASWKQGAVAIGEEQYKWLEEDLSKTELKTLVYCHFPIDNQNLENNIYFKNVPERASVANKVFIRTLFRKSKKVIAVFSGHTHYPSTQYLDDIPYFTIPSFMENDGEDKPSLEYGICTIDDNGVSLEIKKLDI